MKRDLENLDQVVLTDRYLRLRAPQPWRSKQHLWLLIGAILLAQVAIGFGLYFLLRHR